VTTLDRLRTRPLGTRWPRLARVLAHLEAVLPVAVAPLLNEPVEGDRRRRRYDLDDTRVDAPDPGSFRASGQGINFPAVFFFWTVAQLIGGVWWAATMQSNVNNLTQENAKLWSALAAAEAKANGRLDTHELQINTVQNNLDERIRAKAREVLTDWGYIHVPRKGE